MSYHFLNQDGKIELAELKMLMIQEKPKRREFVCSVSGEIKIEKTKRKKSPEIEALKKKKKMLDDKYGFI